ncbi:Crp/Fnr family transcriptional regulator [Pseudoalteromonas mariniglutinosa]|uniref:Crp/Fnr family transcriptional regulator n=1 Tax=Pseudoalteromonas mariniglutinosa TaxID=206042 RepID=UPI00384E55CC
MTNHYVTNQLLDGLSILQRQVILAQCELINLTFGDTVCEQGQPTHFVIYPLTGFISLVTSSKTEPSLELGLIGNEGMLGVTCSLGQKFAPQKAIVQGSGTALRLSEDAFQQQLKYLPLMLKRHNDYLYFLLLQQSQSLVCLRFHQIVPRLAKWLLMTDDRTHGSHFYLTHVFLAQMLGVRRSGITVAAGVLQDKKLISYQRGEIAILNRKGLELVTCDCYQLAKADYLRVLN